MCVCAYYIYSNRVYGSKRCMSRVQSAQLATALRLRGGDVTLSGGGGGGMGWDDAQGGHAMYEVRGCCEYLKRLLQVP
jgi:hypothetical protein